MHDLEEENRDGARKRRLCDMDSSLAADDSNFDQPMDEGFIPRRCVHIFFFFV